MAKVAALVSILERENLKNSRSRAVAEMAVAAMTRQSKALFRDCPLQRATGH